MKRDNTIRALLVGLVLFWTLALAFSVYLAKLAGMQS